jgi:nitroimidazol reductase NimA-like FMN-containing flavoprotein (pyridoxamine 5'-phosphate oxidase superfamily)
MRRADRALDRTQAEAILREGEFGILSTVSPDGQPYGVPVSYAYADGRLCFHCAVEGHKLDNLAVNPRVSFCVVGATEVLPDQFGIRYESAVAFGRSVELFGDDKRRALVALVRKYSAGYIEQGERYIDASIGRTRVFAIDVDRLTGKARRPIRRRGRRACSRLRNESHQSRPPARKAPGAPAPARRASSLPRLLDARSVGLPGSTPRVRSARSRGRSRATRCP